MSNFVKAGLSHVDLTEMSKLIDLGSGDLASFRYIKIYDSVGLYYSAVLHVTYTKEAIFDHIEAWNNHVKDGVTATQGGDRVTLTNSKFVDNSSEADYGTAY